MEIGQAIFKATNGIVELSQLDLDTGVKGNLNRLFKGCRTLSIKRWWR